MLITVVVRVVVVVVVVLVVAGPTSCALGACRHVIRGACAAHLSTT